MGYRHYADDVVSISFKIPANGIDIIRIFDALNDIRNLECAVNATNKENGHAQIAVCYTLGEAVQSIILLSWLRISSHSVPPPYVLRIWQDC